MSLVAIRGYSEQDSDDDSETETSLIDASLSKSPSVVKRKISPPSSVRKDVLTATSTERSKSDQGSKSIICQK